MALDTAIARWRRRERSLMDTAGSTCAITRPGDPGDFDPDTGGYDEDNATGPGGTSVYTGPCMVHMPGAGTETLTAGQEIIETRPVVKIPDLTVEFLKGDLVTVTASVLDPGLVGTVLTVRDAEVDDWTVWRRLVCEVNE